MSEPSSSHLLIGASSSIRTFVSFEIRISLFRFRSKDAESYLNSIKDAKSSTFCVRSGSRLLDSTRIGRCRVH
ncbi:unnamed protein product [Arabidopsis halleri]